MIKFQFILPNKFLVIKVILFSLLITIFNFNNLSFANPSLSKNKKIIVAQKDSKKPKDIMTLMENEDSSQVEALPSDDEETDEELEEADEEEEALADGEETTDVNDSVENMNEDSPVSNLDENKNADVKTNEPQKSVTNANTNPNQNKTINTKEEPLPFIKSKKEAYEGLEVGKRYIEHPNAKKGLIRIDKEKAYYYKVKTSDQKKATSVRFATYEPVDLVNPDNSELRYEDLYDKESWPLITYDQEYQFMQSFGKMAWKWGSGLFVARGNGQFENPQAEEPLEEFTLIVFPLNVGIIYRAQYWDTQLFVPYAEASVPN